MNTKIVIFWIEKTMEEKLHRKKLGIQVCNKFKPISVMWIKISGSCKMNIKLNYSTKTREKQRHQSYYIPGRIGMGL